MKQIPGAVKSIVSEYPFFWGHLAVKTVVLMAQKVHVAQIHSSKTALAGPKERPSGHTASSRSEDTRGAVTDWTDCQNQWLVIDSGPIRS